MLGEPITGILGWGKGTGHAIQSETVNRPGQARSGRMLSGKGKSTVLDALHTVLGEHESRLSPSFPLCLLFFPIYLGFTVWRKWASSKGIQHRWRLTLAQAEFKSGDTAWLTAWKGGSRDEEQTVASLPMVLTSCDVTVKTNGPSEGLLSATERLWGPPMPEGPEQIRWAGDRRKRVNSPHWRRSVTRTDSCEATAFCMGGTEKCRSAPVRSTRNWALEHCCPCWAFIQGVLWFSRPDACLALQLCRRPFGWSAEKQN